MSTADALVNIGPKGIKRRRITGIVVVVVAASVSAWIGAMGVSPFWQFGLLPVLWFAMLCLLQARAKT